MSEVSNWTNPAFQELNELKKENEENKAATQDLATIVSDLKETTAQFKKQMDEIVVNLQSNKIAEVPKKTVEEIETPIDELLKSDEPQSVEEMISEVQNELNKKLYTIIDLPMENLSVSVGPEGQQARTSVFSSTELINLSKNSTKKSIKM